MVKVPILKSNELTSNGNQYHPQAVDNWFNNMPHMSSIPINIRKPNGDRLTVGYVRKNNIVIEGGVVYLQFKDEEIPKQVIGRYLVPSVMVGGVNPRSMKDKREKYKDRENIAYSEIVDFNIQSIEASLTPPAFPSFADSRVTEVKK